MRLYHEGSMIRLHCQLMICRGYIRTSKGALNFFLWLTVLCEKLDIIVKFCTLFSFWLQFQRVINESGGQKSSQGSI